MKRLCRLPIALALLLCSCTPFLQLPKPYLQYYAWHPLLSNAEQHPSATIYAADSAYLQPIVEVSFPTHPGALPRRFLVDTSEPITLISADLANALDLRIRLTEGLPDEDAAGFARIKQLQIGEILMKWLPVAVVRDMRAVGSDDLPVSIDGVLGMNLMSHLGVELAIAEGHMTIFPSGEPLSGAITSLASTPHQLIISGHVGQQAGTGTRKLPTEDGEDGEEELSWAPILAQQSTTEVPVPLAVAELDTEKYTYPSEGPHLFLLGSGQNTTRIHPEVLPWAGSDGTFATIHHTRKSTLLQRLESQLMDELPRANLLEEVSRYKLEALTFGGLTLEDLRISQREAPWTYGGISVLAASDLLSQFVVEFDVKEQRASLRAIEGGVNPPSIQSQLLQWAETTLAPEQNNYDVLQEALTRFIAVGRWPEAAQIASRMVQQNPGDLAAWLVLARQSERRGDFDTGIDLYQRMYWLEGGSVVGRLGSARLYLLQGKFEDALQELQEVQTSDAKSRARIWRLRGHIYLSQGNIPQCKAAMQQALTAGEPDSGALRVLTWLSWQNNNMPEAEQYLRQLLQLTPDDAWAQNAMLSVLRRQNKESEIETWLQGLERLFPYPYPDGRDPIAPLRVRLARERGQLVEMNTLLFNQLRAYGRLAQLTPAPSVKAHALQTQARMYLAAQSHLSEALNLAGQANSADPTGTAGLMVGAAILELMDDPSATAAHHRAWQSAPLDFAAWLATNGARIPEIGPEKPKPKTRRKRKKTKKRRVQRWLPDRKIP